MAAETHTLSTLSPDFEGVRDQLKAKLLAKGSWSALLPTQTGSAIVDLIATVGASERAATMRAKQDAFAETAMSDRALYAIADTQGTRVPRRIPSSVPVTITYEQPTVFHASSITIPAMLQLQGAGTYWFTRDAYTIPSGTTITATLYQGYVVVQTMSGKGSPYQVFLSTEKDFSVSDQDVRVSINNTSIEVTDQGLWNYRAQAAVTDRTAPDGRLRLEFGNASYGTQPAASDTVTISYAVTSGYDGNSVNTIGQTLQPVTSVQGLKIVATGMPSGGSHQPPASVIRTAGATAFGTFSSAVTPRQYLSVALDYPAVVDCKMQAQREIDATDVRLMNTIKVIPLFSTAMSAVDKANFLAYMQARTMYTSKFYIVDPTAVLRSVTMNLRCYGWATLSNCVASARQAVTELFAPKAGFIGYNITLSDIHRVVLASNSGIEYIELASPTSDFTVSGDYMGAPSLTVGAINSGSLAAGSYAYSIGVIDNNGEVAPVNLGVAVVPSNGSITINWTPYPNAVTYKIYGRLGGSLGLLATLPATTLSWFDNGGAAVGAAPLTASSYPSLYNTLDTLVVTAAYSNRTRSSV